MGAKSKAGAGGGDFERVENGSYPARCIHVVELGTHDKTWEGTSKKVEELMITWELSELMEDGKPFVVNWRGTNSLSERANLFKMLTAWRGKAFTDEELNEFHLGKLIDATCLISVVSEKGKNDKVYTNVSAIMPLPKGMKAEPRVNDTVDFGICDLGEPEWDNLWPWVQKIIEKSDEGKEFFGQGAPAQQNNGGGQPPIDPDDDIPF
jgi:hypothetical protein